jgi:hypothetical protein
MIHGYYAAMGGFAVEVDPLVFPTDPSRKIPNRLTLTTRGVLLLAECGHAPNVSRAFISDKSKAHPVAKLLVCFQALWCLAEYTGRVASHLPITLLEINTLGHALCALIIYLFWWRKPLDVKEPLVITGEWVPPLAAFMWMSSQVSSGFLAELTQDPGPELGVLTYTYPWAEPEQPRDTSHSPVLDHIILDDNILSPIPTPDPELGYEHSSLISPLLPTRIDLQPLQPIPGTCFMLRKIDSSYLQRFRLTRLKFLNRVIPTKLTLTPSDIRRWKLATEAVKSYPAIAGRVTPESPRFSILHPENSDLEEFLMTRCPNWPGKDLLQGNFPVGLLAFALSIASAAYGGLHATAWDYYFPTTYERFLWRFSCIVVFLVGISVSTAIAMATNGSGFDEIIMQAGFEGDLFQRFLGVSYFGICGLVWVGYVACRTFLVVEAFVSVRELPADAYKTPWWTQPLPHF